MRGTASMGGAHRATIAAQVRTRLLCILRLPCLWASARKPTLGLIRRDYAKVKIESGAFAEENVISNISVGPAGARLPNTGNSLTKLRLRDLRWKRT